MALLLGLWLWGNGLTEVPAGTAGPATGDMAAAGRPPLTDLPTVHRPLTSAEPLTLDIPGLDLRAPVVARGLDERGAPTRRRWTARARSAGTRPGPPPGRRAPR